MTHKTRDDAERALADIRKRLENEPGGHELQQSQAELAQLTAKANKYAEECNQLVDELKQYLRIHLDDAQEYGRRKLMAAGFPVEMKAHQLVGGPLAYFLTHEGEIVKELPDLPAARLLETPKLVRSAIAMGDAELGVVWGLALARELLDNGQPRMMERAASAVNRMRASKPRRPKLRTRAILAALYDGRDTAEAVEGFLEQTRGEIPDDWGEISIHADDAGFIVIDEGAKLPAGGERPSSKPITHKNLPGLIAEARKKMC